MSIQTNIVDARPLIRGTSFNVDAEWSSFTIGTVNSNEWCTWYKDMAEYPDSVVAEVTKGLVSPHLFESNPSLNTLQIVSYTLGKTHTNVANTYVVSGFPIVQEFQELTRQQQRAVLSNFDLRARLGVAEPALDPRRDMVCIARSVRKGRANVDDPSQISIQTWTVPVSAYASYASYFRLICFVRDVRLPSTSSP